MAFFKEAWSSGRYGPRGGVAFFKEMWSSSRKCVIVKGGEL